MKTTYEEYLEKLKQLINYVDGIMYLPLVMLSNDLKLMKWYVGASYVTQDYCKEHTRAILTIEQGAVASIPPSQTEYKYLNRDQACQNTQLEATYVVFGLFNLGPWGKIPRPNCTRTTLQPCC